MLSTALIVSFAAVFAGLLLIVTIYALRTDGRGLRDLGLVPSARRLCEFAIGLSIAIVLFAMLGIVRGSTVSSIWSVGGWTTVIAALTGLGVSLVLLLPEELIFRGYAFRQLVDSIGAWPAVLFSAACFGMYHVAGTGLSGPPALSAAVMPAIGGLVFGWAAVRTRGLALPIGLHLGGNWVQASVFQPLRYGADLSSHAPYIVAMGIAMFAVTLSVPAD